MTATATPVRTTLAGIADHRFVSVDARICAIDLKHEDTHRPWAVIALVDGAVMVDVNVYPVTYALTSQHLRVGSVVTVSGEVATDADGLFMAAHTIHPAGEAQ
jgi:hypothetical protein